MMTISAAVMTITIALRPRWQDQDKIAKTSMTTKTSFIRAQESVRAEAWLDAIDPATSLPYGSLRSVQSDAAPMDLYHRMDQSILIDIISHPQDMHKLSQTRYPFFARIVSQLAHCATLRYGTIIHVTTQTHTPNFVMKGWPLQTASARRRNERSLFLILLWFINHYECIHLSFAHTTYKMDGRDSTRIVQLL